LSTTLFKKIFNKTIFKIFLIFIISTPYWISYNTIAFTQFTSAIVNQIPAKPIMPIEEVLTFNTPQQAFILLNSSNTQQVKIPFKTT
jgi:hypothetical protein